jgi:CHAT domain-containing protein
LSQTKKNASLQNLVNLELSKIFLREGKYQDINLSKEIAKQLFMSNAFSPNTFPEKWIDLCFTLGQVYLELIGSKQVKYTLYLQDFIKNLFGSLFTLLDNKQQPRLWAKSKLISSDFCLYDNKPQQALEYSLDAFEVLDSLKKQFPTYWSEASGKLGCIYSALGDMQNAILRFREALQIFEPKYSPKECLKMASNLGNLGYNLQNWEIAIEGYSQAILAIEQSRYWATSEATKRELIANSLDIYQKMVQACINHQDYAQALLTVERSKSRTLIELLDSANLYPKNATDQQKQRISNLRRQIAIYQQQLAFTPSDTLTPTTEKHPNQPSPETLIRQQLQSANQQFQDLLTELDDPNFTLTQQVPAQLPDLRRLLQPQTALIEWYLPSEAESGFYLFLVTRRRDEQIQITPHHFSATDRQHLDQALLDYRSDYGQRSWNDQLPQRLATLSAALQLPRILPELSQIQHLILIPHRELHLIPLHALPVSLPSPSGNEGKPLQDWFPVQYAPSCQILNNLQQRPPLNRETVPFFAIQNPTEDLNYAEWGVELLRRQFSPHQVLRRDQAILANLSQPHTQTFLEQSHTVHFGCHGEFDQRNPLNAYLRLANGEKLTFLDIFNGLNIPLCRLLVLSACKTGLVETSRTDDYVGLSSAFFYAGARTVVASLWEVDELAATLVTLRLYQILPDYPSVTAALQAAQTWLRGLSSDDVLHWLKHDQKATEEEVEEVEDRLSLFNDPPFAEACYWSAFTAIGL